LTKGLGTYHITSKGKLAKHEGEDTGGQPLLHNRSECERTNTEGEQGRHKPRWGNQSLARRGHDGSKHVLEVDDRWLVR